MPSGNKYAALCMQTCAKKNFFSQRRLNRCNIGLADPSCITPFNEERQLMNQKENKELCHKKDYPTACTHSAPQSAVRNFWISSTVAKCIL